MYIDPKGEMFTNVVLEIFKVNGMLNAEGDEMSKEFGMSSARWKVLGAIVKLEQAATVAQIGRTMGQSRQATQRLVDVMVKDGLLKMLDNPHHKRAKLVDLTDEGKRVYNFLYIKQLSWAAKGADGLDLKDLETTLATLQKMSQHFDK
ncbi:MarR family winged helix-turn-helix transcriptional regulator [Vibrio sp. Isolate30]|uniref:MarR family winged helix-turn-helix transcriptional regulator n=1 Tax=Vibrio TaxID=662 RepID=UPI001EFD4B79|nr:MarR family winged helix-turn-helix transcriptional regulator [Vibrio sp. Isolate30]MCG9633267.1 MarR family transcriptional regulator [Vibrio sp. Isolate30]